MSELDDSDNGSDVLLVGFEDQENLGLRSIAAYLNHAGVRVSIAPCQKLTRQELLARIFRARPKIVGFSLIFQRMLPDFSDLIAYLRKKGIKAHFTIGGHYPTFEYQRILDEIPGLDTVIRHEGEITLLELTERLNKPEDWDNIKGLVYRKNGTIAVNPSRPLIANLDSLPSVIRSRNPERHRGIGICSLSSSRGCYYNCCFCSIQEFYREPKGPKRRSRSARNVVKEMDNLFHEFGIRVFIFQDDDWFMKGQQHQKFIIDFLDELNIRGLDDQILWRISCRIDDLDASLLRRMQRAGLISVYLGIESGSDAGLKTFNKHYCVEDVYNAISMLEDIGMPYEYGFMILEPDSTMATVRENIEFLKWIAEEGASLANFCKMAPYAGTPIARRLHEESRIRGSAASPEYSFLDPRLNFLQFFISKTFNFRNFSNSGLVEQLRFAKFDCYLLQKFYANQFDIQLYEDTIKDLITRCNTTALETLSMATRFIEEHTEEEIISNWTMLEHLREKEQSAEVLIGQTLDQLLRSYEFYSPVPLYFGT